MAEPSVPAADARSPGLVGRHREQVVLREQLAAALAGEGGLVLIRGEAGIRQTAPARAPAREGRGPGPTTPRSTCCAPSRAGWRRRLSSSSSPTAATR